MPFSGATCLTGRTSCTASIIYRMFQPGLLVLLAIALIVCIVVAQWKRSFLKRLFQPRRSLIVATSFGTIILISAILNFREHGQRYLQWRSFDAQESLAYSNALLDAVIEETEKIKLHGNLLPPIVFRYLDGKALEGLYGEIEPDSRRGRKESLNRVAQEAGGQCQIRRGIRGECRGECRLGFEAGAFFFLQEDKRKSRTESSLN